MKFTFKSLLLVCALLVGSVNAWADPDLNDYTILKTLDFSSSHWGGSNVTMVTGDAVGTVNGTGVNDIVQPEEFSGYLALQGANNGSGNGWWLRAEKGGLFAYGAGRVGKVYNLKKDYIVKITSTVDVESAITFPEATNSFTYEVSDDTYSYYCTMTEDGYIGFNGTKNGNNGSNTYGYITSIVIYVPEGELLPPTANLTKVEEDGKTYTITNPNAGGTLYYTTSVDTDGKGAPSVGDGAYSSTEETSVEVKISESGNLYAYVVNGATTSEVATFSVDATKETLNTPLITISSMAETGEKYYPVIAISHEPKVGNFTPSVTLSYDLDGADVTESVKNNTYTFTTTGTLTVTATAAGYVSATASFEVANEYVESKVIDFSALKSDDFSELWTSKTGDLRDYWTNRSLAIPADVTYYTLTDPTAESAATAIEGITITNYANRQPQIYIGYGLYTPYDQLSGNSNYMNFNVNGATESDYIVYSGWNNYGNGTFTTVQSGNAQFALNRYDTILKSLIVYSPYKTADNVSVTISPAGYTTFSSEYALNLDELPEGLTAYYVADGGINESSVTVTPAKGDVKAGEGLIFKGEADNTYSVSIAETGSELEGNLLVAVATATNAPVGSYVFAYDEADLENSVGFYRVSEDYAAPVPAGKAYLSAGGSEAKTLRIVFGDETATAIEVPVAEEAADGVLYNVAGQLVGNDYKGIVIKNGKKYLNK